MFQEEEIRLANEAAAANAKAVARASAQRAAREGTSPGIFVTFTASGERGLVTFAIEEASAFAAREDQAGSRGDWCALEDYFDGSLLWPCFPGDESLRASVAAFFAPFEGNEVCKAGAIAFGFAMLQTWRVRDEERKA